METAKQTCENSKDYYWGPIAYISHSVIFSGFHLVYHFILFLFFLSSVILIYFSESSIADDG